MKIQLTKSIFYYSCLAISGLLSIGLVSCEDSGIDSQPEFEPKITWSAETQYDVLSINVSDIELKVSSNRPWDILSDQEWCTVSPVNSGESSLVSNVVISIEDNETLKAREAVVEIKAEGATSRRAIIKQESKVVLEVDMFETEALFKHESESKSFRLRSTRKWTIQTDQEWMTFDVANGSGNPESVDVVATVLNNDSETREVNVIISNGLKEKKFVFRQQEKL
ncbi:BACON domain-containing protein [Halosquirtibacter xylanolyticus]|uniref:BACON domain-containing protein n=1 Tax=Halosquirtibacter xylanolyticus TaxID=3374599 RepID=UPI00374A6BC8|nr:BACON domain-containing protein [Prolixibacteraceae bacterium]